MLLIARLAVTLLFFAQIITEGHDTEEKEAPDPPTRIFNKPTPTYSGTVFSTSTTGRPTTIETSTRSGNNFPFNCNGKYFWYTIHSLSYHAAAASCTDLGGRLIVIKSKEVSDCVEGLIRAAGLQNHHFWIGLTRTGLGSLDFAWSDGTLSRQGDFSNWVLGQPDNLDGAEYCVGLNGWENWNLGWNDFRCAGERFDIGYLCEAR